MDLKREDTRRMISDEETHISEVEDNPEARLIGLARCSLS